MALVPHGLKLYAPILGDFLNLSPLAVYERQRALTALGLLELVRGRGPNSGVRATPDAVATIAIAALFTDNLGEIDHRIEKLLKAKTAQMIAAEEKYGHAVANIESGTKQFARLGRIIAKPPTQQESASRVCGITGASTFRNAVARAFGDSAICSKISIIGVQRAACTGMILGENGACTKFGRAPFRQASSLETFALLSQETIKGIGSTLAAFAGDE